MLKLTYVNYISLHQANDAAKVSSRDAPPQREKMEPLHIFRDSALVQIALVQICVKNIEIFKKIVNEMDTAKGILLLVTTSGGSRYIFIQEE